MAEVRHITRRAVLSTMSAASMAAAAPAFATETDETAWAKATRLAHELSEALERLNHDGSLACRVYAPKSGHARVRFVEAEPSEAHALLNYHADCYKQVAMALDPTATEWTRSRRDADADLDCRFFMIGVRPRRK